MLKRETVKKKIKKYTEGNILEKNYYPEKEKYYINI